jgi:hypothetical protein
MDLEENKQLISNCKAILKNDYEISISSRVLIIYDTETTLAQELKKSFAKACEELANSYDCLDFKHFNLETFKEELEWNYKKGDIIILLQSTSFRVSKFRWRNELCSKGFKVLEMGQLRKIKENEIPTFINSLHNDKEHYFQVTNKIIPLLKKASTLTIISENGSIVNYTGKLDEIYTNIGDLKHQSQFGSRYPIGEIVSEAKDLSTVSGVIEVYAYPNLQQETTFVEPFTCSIKDGLVISHTGPQEFEEIIQMIQTEHPEGKVYVRELGLGLNRGIKRFSRLGDPISYERQEGLHFSLGMKHGLYQKKLWPIYGKKFYQRYHIDVYVNVKEIYCDDTKIFENGKGYLI